MADSFTTAPLASPSCYRQWPATVSQVAHVADQLRRVTLTADEFRTFVPTGPDECCGLYLPPAGEPLVMPDVSGMNVHAGLQKLPQQQRPEIRWYTVRAHRSDQAEVDIDIVVHPEPGPGMMWLQNAQPGCQVGFRSGASGFPAYSKDRVAAAGRQRAAAGQRATAGPRVRRLVVADESAAPALCAIRDSLSEAHRATALFVIETSVRSALAPTPPDVHVLSQAASPGLATAQWLHQQYPTGQDLPSPWDFVWVAGESALATNFRRHVINFYDMAPVDVFFSGYWHRGQSAA